LPGVYDRKGTVWVGRKREDTLEGVLRDGTGPLPDEERLKWALPNLKKALVQPAWQG